MSDTLLDYSTLADSIRVQGAREAAGQRRASLDDEDRMCSMHMHIDVVDGILTQVTRPAHHVPS